MYLSVNWLKQFLPELDNDEAEDIAQKMSTSLTEVENVFNVAKELDGIISGEIVEIVDHPKLDKIKITNIKTPEKEYQVLCGANNVKVGNIVPLCIPGGTVYISNPAKGSIQTIKIDTKEMGGIKSEGMLCSARELGIGEDHTGIYILPDDTPLGQSINETLYDTIIEIENKGLTHRPDCFSHIGIAREIAVQNKLKFILPESPKEPIQTSDLYIEANVQNTEDCMRYSLLTLSDIEVKDSPLWLKLRLMAAGMRPVNNIVDISNYIMLETGQPSHILDYDKISEGTLILRNAKKGEKVKTLDGEERELSPEMLVNADNKGILGIAGVMGAERAEISSITKNIVIQVENFEMFNIRRTTRKLGIRTEASSRFEKGLDPEMVNETVFRLAEMIQDLAGGEIASEIIDIYPKQEKNKTLSFNVEELSNFLGVKIENKEILRILKSLDIKIEDLETKEQNIESISDLKLTIPSFRRDIKIQKDIYEEIIRIYGYDKVEFNLPKRNLKPANKNKRFHFEKQLIKLLSSSGSSEVYSYAFVGEDLYKSANLNIKNNLKLKNPLSPELAYMRDTLLPSLLEKFVVNQSRFDDQDIYEISKTALKKIDEDTKLHVQPKLISGLFSEKIDQVNLFRKIKGKIKYITNQIGVKNVRFENINNTNPFEKSKVFHPYKSAIIYSGDNQIGIVGYIHPEVINNFGISQSVVGYELNFDLLFELSREEFQFRTLNNLPTSTRNISFWINERVEMREIINTIDKLNIDILSERLITDIYRDKNHPDKKSITLEIVLQPQDNTLKDNEISDTIKKISDAILDTFKVEIREK